MKVAVVTGASRGIGKAVAQGLAEDGYDLALAARSQNALQATKSEILNQSAQDNKVALYPLDVTDGKAVETMVSDIVSNFGRIDLLFNSAGIVHKGTADLTFEEFSAMIDVNLKAVFRLLHEVVPVMAKQKSGTIINLASRAGKQAPARLGGYAASKFGVVGLNEALYRDLTKYGIKVTALCPGWVNTAMGTDSSIEPEHMIQTDDIIKTVRWIESLSPSACVPDIFIESIKQV